MPSSADKRKAKYAAKYDGVTVGTRYGFSKDVATAAFNDTADQLAGYEAQVKTDILAAASPAVPSYQTAAYLSFMRQCFAASRKFQGAQLTFRLQSYAHRWAYDGLKGTLLIAIAAIFSSTILDPHTHG